MAVAALDAANGRMRGARLWWRMRAERRAGVCRGSDGASWAVETAMSESCSTSGSGMTPQSAIKRTPLWPKPVSSTSMTMQLEAVVAMGRNLDDLEKEDAGRCR